eukprot:TRINITY_DN71489_c0_g1_i1.p1 TRINITY_DN71489_c0_g1~~TRINITY_DN71489_c0_g1_i1.p1  ORF type:complete len:269 (+),score=85.15 TRINITY_DN71489_c0_g1_i1:82-888(+)
MDIPDPELDENWRWRDPATSSSSKAAAAGAPISKTEAQGKSLDERWPRIIPADVDAEAARFLRWAESDVWLPPGPSNVIDKSVNEDPDLDKEDEASKEASRGWEPSGAFVEGLLNPGQDPWDAMLATGDEEFCEVPVALLEYMRKIGQVQVTEIESLKAEVAKFEDVKASYENLQVELRELETLSVVESNEAELLSQEADYLDGEAVRLQESRQFHAEKLSNLTVQIKQLESWLEEHRKGASPPADSHNVSGGSSAGQLAKPSHGPAN